MRNASWERISPDVLSDAMVSRRAKRAARSSVVRA